MPKAKKRIPLDPQKVRAEYCKTGFQYYLTGRFAAIAGLIPVAGNLYHHAVERLLKAALAAHFTEAERKKLSHNLTGIWDSVKGHYPQTNLMEFDSTIETLDPFESIRYPERILEKGLVGGINWRQTDTSEIEGYQVHKIVVPDIDRLIARLFELCSMNPVVMTFNIGEQGKAVLRDDNPEIAKWFPAE